MPGRGPIRLPAGPDGAKVGLDDFPCEESVETAAEPIAPDYLKPNAEQNEVELRVDCAVGSVFERLLVPQTMVTPAGFEPAISTLKGSRPWPG